MLQWCVLSRSSAHELVLAGQFLEHRDTPIPAPRSAATTSLTGPLVARYRRPRAMPILDTLSAALLTCRPPLGGYPEIKKSIKVASASIEARSREDPAIRWRC
jgi:hypothetical protein